MIEFWKISGAGNDFILLRNFDGALDGILTEEFISSVCSRSTSVGADGLIELSSDSDTAFRMKYWNRDGISAAMCGNGARCACVFADRIGILEGGSRFTFRSDAGIHTGEVTSDSTARIWLTDPVTGFLGKNLDYGGRYPVSYVVAGVPHAVLFATDPDDSEFDRFAEILRRHEEFQPGGANVDYAFISGRHSITLRTFELGVESETLACGTGAVAAVLCARELFPDMLSLPVQVQVRSGLQLEVGQDEQGWWLMGEARIVYRGYLEPIPFT
jgi:diaminopimelate epimerase